MSEYRVKSCTLRVRILLIPFTFIAATIWASCVFLPETWCVDTKRSHSGKTIGVSGKRVNKPLKGGKFSRRIFNRHAQAIFACRASRHGPEFHQVLRRHVQGFVLRAQGAHRTLDEGAMGVMRLEQPQQDVRVD